MVTSNNKGNKIDCVVIGLGRIGFELSFDPYREKPCTHTEAIQAHSRTRLIAGIDIDAKKRKSFTQKTNIPSYPNWEVFSQQHPLPGILCIATPPPSHGEYLRIALKNKIPVAIVEKPITSEYRKALALKKTFHQSPTRVVVNHERRFADDYVYVKQVIDKKKYGELLSLNGYLFTGLEPSEHALYHDGTHLLDIADFLTSHKKTNTLTQIKKLRRQLEPSHDQALRFTVMLNHIPCFFEVGGGKQFFHFEMQIIFQKGMIHIGNHIFREWQAGPSQHYQGFVSLHPQKKAFPHTHYFMNMFAHAVHLHDHPHLHSQSSIEDALLIFKISKRLKLKN